MTVARLNVMTQAHLGLLIPEKFDKRVRDDRRQREFWGRFAEAEGKQAAVIEKSDFKKEAGDRIHMEVISELYGPPTIGEAQLRGREEKFKVNRFTVGIEVYRHAVAVTDKGNAQAIVDSIQRAVPKLGRYFANLYDDMAFNEILNPANATPAVIYAGTANSDDELTTTCRMSPDVLDLLSLAMKRRGALPIQIISTRQDSSVELYALVMSEVDWMHLHTNTVFRQMLKDTLPRDYNHPLITGAKGLYSGILLHTYDSIHMGCMQGSPLRPEVALEETTAAGASKLKVGSSDTDWVYTKNFPATGEFPITIMADGVNDAEELVVKRSEDNDYELDIVGGTTANDHLKFSRIVYGKYRSQAICFGAEVLARAWGEADVPIHQEDNYGMDRGVGIKSTVGVACIQSSSGSIPNALVVRCYSDLPNSQSRVL